MESVWVDGFGVMWAWYPGRWHIHLFAVPKLLDFHIEITHGEDGTVLVLSLFGVGVSGYREV
jgi:hypothetical protein